jgi:hypothetical protein
MRRAEGHRRPVTAIALVLTLAVCAWWVLSIVQSTALNRAQAILGTRTSLPAAPARHVESLLNVAGTLNPDRTVGLERVDLLLDEGRKLAARRLARQITRAEPQNIIAWVDLAHASYGNPKLFNDAIAHVERLEPRIPNT